MSFEILFITEDPECTPAAEIQFNEQRLCIVRLPRGNVPQIEFVQDLYVGRTVQMTFPLAQFQEIVQVAVDGLAAWLQNLADGRPEA